MLSLLSTLQSHVATAKDRLREEEEGATAVEYGLLVGLIAIVIIAAVVFLGPTLGDIFLDINESLGGEGPAAEVPADPAD
ncbi:Flp family type IVb pilin [Rathayibacter sp. SD072]|uniref:Flp family type IVb pilin n=1 Tax=Rathayibacter sp. SD072 TaxID=2781731 RepID=UPI001A95A138|nr:Flp family type IVb pilin [Rathayibacter sp. SD072]MBO0984272.1 Flp family type IVb pilin [Rathayibacter sp. SD072]